MPLEVATGRPDPRLARMIRPFTGYVERTEGRLVRPEYPHGNVTLILSFGPAIDFPGLGGARPGSFASGLFTEPVLTGRRLPAGRPARPVSTACRDGPRRTGR